MLTYCGLIWQAADKNTYHQRKGYGNSMAVRKETFDDDDRRAKREKKENSIAIRKGTFADYDSDPALPKKRSRITIDVSPELRRKIRVAAAERDLSISEFLGRILEEEVSEEIESRFQQRHFITQEAIDRLRQVQEEIMQDRQGKPFEESTLEMLWRSREERTRELMGEE